MTVTAQTNAGDNYKATIKGKGNCTGTVENVAWSIGKATPTADIFTYTVPTNLDFDGAQKTAMVGVKDNITGMGEITVKYYKNGEEEGTTTPPTDAGTYTVKISVAEGTNFYATDGELEMGSFTIAKATPTADIFTYTAPTNLDFDGAQKTAMVGVKDNITGMGEITVKYYKNGEEEGTTTPPTDAGTYSVKIFVAEGTNFYATDSELEMGSFTIAKATPYIVTPPTAADITFGQSVSDSTLTGGAAQHSESKNTTVAGIFSWKDKNKTPTVADSNNTGYDVIFTPDDKDNYETVSTKVKLTVKPSDTTPNMPESTMSALYSQKTVGAVELPEGWGWNDVDSTKELTVGKAVEATAIYNGADKGNYNTESVTISITREDCTHTGETEVKDAKEATCGEEGYTGDTYCKDCGKQTATGKVIEKEAHTYGESTFSWSEDGKTCTVVFTCKEDAEHIARQEAKVTSEVKTAATCKAKGTTTYTATYTDAGKVYSAEGKTYTEAKDVEDIPLDADNHVGKTEVRDVKKATCGEDGYTGSIYCKDCEQKIGNGAVIEKAVHTYGDPTFSWSEDGKTCTVTFTCKNDASHTDTQKATVTSEVKTASTCSVKGTTTYTATYTDKDKIYSSEGKTYTDTKDVADIPADETKHVESDIVYTGDGDKAPTCTEAGIGHTECTKCQKPMQTNVSVEATGHTGGTATCKDKAECTDCHETYGELDKKNHTGETVVKNAKEATCGADGYTGDVYCKDCGEKVKAGTVIPKTETHTGGTATCKDKAECTVCHETYGELDQDNHAGETGVRDAREATCGVDGYTGDTYCKDCGTKTATGTKIDKTGAHTWDTGKVTKEPTATAEGEKTYTCGVCGETKVDKIPATGNTDTGNTDTGNTDTGNTDTGNTDTGNTDTGNTDTGNTDTGNTDTGNTDTGNTDTGNTDTGNTDTGNTDTGNTDTGNTDTGNTDTGNTATGNTDKKLPAVGTEITNADGSATYQVTEAGENGNAVTYEASTNKEATTVVIPATVTINNNTYKVTTISDTAFAGNKKVTSVTIGDNVTDFSANTFKGCSNLKTVDVGDGVTSIPANAFKSLKKLTTVKLGSGVKTIGKNAFSGCSKLKTVTIGKNVTTISDKAFYKCTSLTKVAVPTKTKTIGKSTFEGCKSLKTVTTGKSVTKIGAKAFYGCSKMKTLTIKSSGLTTKKIGSKAFTKTPKNMTVKVPKKKFKAYKSMLIKRGVNKNAKFKKN